MGRIKLTETALRDAHQSLLATRLRTEDMIPILPAMDRIGYWSVEMWGGATFDSALRFLQEDPWERLRIIRKLMPNTRMQMLLRGQNIVGYRHYADDIVEKFVGKASDLGIDVFRVFDAMNDIRNLKKAIECIKKAGKIAEGTLSYTVSPVHSVDLFVSIAKELESMGCDTICIKDMAGLITPYSAGELVSALVQAVSIPVHVHCHCTSGMAEMAYVKAVEAGAVILDVAVSSMAGGTSQPPSETIITAFRGTEFDTGIDLSLVEEVSSYFREVRKKYSKFESEYTGVDVKVLQNQIPGGMVSNLANQLREQGALDKMYAVLNEVPRVRADLGYPPLVTPTSQIVGTQATLNVLTGERYKTIPRETKNYFMGMYGRPPGDVNPEVAKIVLGGEKPYAGRPADLISLEWEKAEKECADFAITDEDVLSYVLFPQVAKKFFDSKKQEKREISEEVAAAVAAVIDQAMSEDNDRKKERADPAISPWKMAGRWELLKLRSAGKGWL
jgi:pyruvate carboxylase subunit B